MEAAPFNARSQAGGETRFTELDSGRTGIVTTNRYDDPRMWQSRHREYAVGPIGTGVAVGDYDGDGLPDVFVVSKIESPRLFRNLGDLRFEDATVAAGVLDESGEWKQGAAFADVNNDGWLDLYVCRFAAANQLYMNQGDGTFREEAADRGLTVVDSSGMGCFADYDRDGWLDVYVQTNLLDGSASPDGQRDYLFRNKGDGTFENVTDRAGIQATLTQGHSATWWDQNEDGWPDLYVANDFGPPDFLYRNNGDGTFTDVIDAALPHTSFSSMGSDIGDVDNDGDIDFFVADMAGSTIEAEHRGQSDSRAKLDPKQNEQLDTAIQTLWNALYLNTGTTRSLEVAHLAGIAATDWTWSARFEDLDNDGRIDLFVTNGMDREQNNLDLIQKRLLSVSGMGRMRVLKDSPVFAQRNLVYANRGDLRFEEVGREWGMDQLGTSFGAAFGDFDADGDLDVVFTNYQQPATFLRNDSETGNSVVFALRGTKSNRFGIGARIEVTTAGGTQARQLVLGRGYLSTSEPIAHFGLGAESKIERVRVVWPSGREQVVEGLSSGNRYTLTEPESESPKAASSRTEAALFTETSSSLGLSARQGEEDLEGTVNQALLPRRFNRRGPGVAVGDLDGDGVDEIVLGATALEGTKVFKRGAGVFQLLDTGPLGEKPSINDGPPLIFDANGDGANDVLLTAGGAALPAEEPEYEPRLFLNDGRGRFTAASEGVLPSAPISVGAAVAADFDRDGALDVFLGGRLFPGYYPEPPVSVLLFRRGQQFKDETTRFAKALSNVGLVTSALASDVDADGWVDLIVALEWGGVRFFRNVTGKELVDTTEEWGFDSAGAGLWTSLAAADFNGDGRLDYAVGNLGLNTHLFASRDHPLRLFYGDFGGSTEFQIVLAFDDNGSLRPVASKEELETRIPGPFKRFESNNAFAKATLEEIFGAATLERATELRAGELRSGVLLSGEGGRYAFAPLPRSAQIAPIQGMEAGDFDGDGMADLLFCANDYSAIPQLGRFDGGLGWFLRGDGRGGFQVAPIRESGWSAPGNAKALAVLDLDLDARPDAFVSRNDAASLAFRNGGDGVGQRIALRLIGQGGNRSAIGARVEIVSGSRILSVAEIRAGGGYASQSSPTVFVTAPEDASGDLVARVRWPSGATQTVPLSGKSGYVEIRE